MTFCCGIGYNPFYNPSISNWSTGLQAVTATCNAITSGIRARKGGADPYTSAAVGLNTGTWGLASAFMGNAIDKSTGTYLGSAMGNMTNSIMTMNSFMPTYSYMPMMSSMFTMPLMFGTMTPMGGFYRYC